MKRERNDFNDFVSGKDSSKASLATVRSIRSIRSDEEDDDVSKLEDEHEDIPRIRSEEAKRRKEVHRR